MDEKRLAKLGLNPEDFKPNKAKKKEEPKTNRVTDDDGNVYEQFINTDGTIRLKLVESYNGELFE